MSLIPPPRFQHFSGDEMFVALSSSLVWVLTTWIWFRQLKTRPQWLPAASLAHWLRWSPFVALVLVHALLQRWASHDVRDDPFYLWQYTALGGAWIGVTMLAMPWLGLSARDDVGERRNDAAAVALIGLVFAVASTYAGGNIGDGPGWWVVLFSSGLATLSLVVLQWLGATLGRTSETITIERDIATGLRAALGAVAQGLILSRAAAGDWVSASATLSDFAARGWPAVMIALFAIAVDRALRPGPKEPHRSAIVFGLVPGVAFVFVAVVWLVFLGAAP